MNELDQIDLIIAMGVFGLVIGSFLNVVALRIPRRESLLYPPSHCPNCQTPLQPIDLIPLISWLLLRGKCRHCKVPIHWQYPLVEGATGVLWGLMAWRYGWSAETLVGLIFISFLIPLTVIDFREFLLPNRLTYPLLVMAILYRLMTGDHSWWVYLSGGILGAGILWLLAWLSPKLLGKEGMGLGDVKLMAGIGVTVGVAGAIVTLFVASAGGLLYGLLLKMANRLGTDGHIPFGPFLAIGAIISYLFGDAFVTWYFSLMLL